MTGVVGALVALAVLVALVAVLAVRPHVRRLGRSLAALRADTAAGVARLRRVVGTGLVRLGLTLGRDGPTGHSVGVMVRSRWWRRAEARQ